MSIATPSSVALRDLLTAHRSELDTLLEKYGADNPRLFGSVARGEALPGSDIDIIVDLLPDHPQSELVRVSGLNAEFRDVLGHEVDVFAPQVMKDRVSASAVRDAVPL